MLIITSILLVVTGIQFCITDYLVQVMDVDIKEAFKLFFLVGLAGPVMGIVSSAILFDRIGGYTNERAIPISFAFGTGGMVFGLLSVLVGDSAIICAFFIMLELFCGAFVLTAAVGIMLNQVPPGLRTMANSVANFSYNLFGFLPAPVIYGIFYERGGGRKSHLGLISIQLFTILAFCIFSVAYLRERYILNKYIDVVDFSSIGASANGESQAERNKKLVEKDYSPSSKKEHASTC